MKKRNVTHDWNAKIQSLFADKVAKTYDNFIDEVTSAESSLMCNTADFFLKLENELEGDQAVVSTIEDIFANPCAQRIKISRA